MHNAASNLGSLEEACKRELSTLFAHITHESGNPDSNQPEFTGMRNMREKKEECDPCLYHFDSGIGNVFPAQGNYKYKGRGPIHLRWNHRYG